MARFLILYGSQTGTAQDVAEQLWRDAKRRFYVDNTSPVVDVKLYAMDDYDIRQLIEENIVVFICSTTGQGESPDNMKNFWRFLCQRHLSSDALADLRTAVVGLGDSSYQKFNFAAKKLYRRLSQLGAINLLPLALADDQHDAGYDAVVEPWIRDLWTTLSNEDKFRLFLRNIPLLKNENVDHLFPKYRLEFCDEENSEENREISHENSSFCSEENGNIFSSYNRERPYCATLLENRRVTAEDHFQDTRFLRFDVKNSEIYFQPGDVVYIQPQNLHESRVEFLNLLDHLNVDRPFYLFPSDSSFKKPSKSILTRPCTFRQCASTFFDLQSIPRRSFFSLLAEFAEQGSLEHEKLLEFSSTDGQQDYFSYCTRPRRTVVETMRDFPQTIRRVPLRFWFDLLSSIRPRPFSIASYADAQKNEIQILVAVVKFKTRLVAPRLGLCSNFLARLAPGAKVNLWTGKGAFRFSKNADAKPFLMIGPGTGVAPFRSILYWRISTTKIMENVLFFGCRNERKDFYFQEEFEGFIDDGKLKLITAFSRDSEDGKKIYVQHKLREMRDVVADLIMEKEACVFVAGNAKEMPKDVLEALKEILKFHINKSGHLNEKNLEELVENYLGKMEKENRLQMETWS